MNAEYQKIGNTVWKFSLLILLLGAMVGVARNHLEWEFRYPLMLLTMPLSVILHGWITGTLVPARAGTAMEVLKENWARYLVVAMAVGIGRALVAYLFALWVLPAPAGIIKLILVRVILDVLTVYIVPVVFVHRTHLPAIPAGVTFLFGNFRRSWDLVGGIVLVNVILYASVYLPHLTTWDGSFVLSVLLVTAGVTINFLVFAGAVLRLVAPREP